MNEGKALTTQETGLAAVIRAVERNPTVEPKTIRELFDIQKEIMEIEARQAFNADMAALQSQLPTITERGEIKHNGKLISRYAKFEDINEAVRPLLKGHGFSVSFRSAFPEGQLEITGIISHRAGHHEETSMRLPFDTSGAKNNVQAIGSSVSYGKRYALCMLLNISTGGEDDDANKGGGPTPITEEQAADLQALLDEGDFKTPDFLKAMGSKLKGNFESLQDLPAVDYDGICEWLRRQIKAKQ